MNENRKEELLNNKLSEDELEGVSGGNCWNGARFVAPDGHDVGCKHVYYKDNAFDRNDFSVQFKHICYVDGGPHKTDGRQYCGDGHYRVLCSKCHQYLDMNGNYSGLQCAMVDGDGNYLGMIY